MNSNRIFVLLGFIGPLVAYVCIWLSISLSHSFSWHVNALSDLGHARNSSVAPIFNLGLLLSGFLIALYSIKSLANYAKYTSIMLLFSALMLQAVATFDEIYGRIHFIVSIIFFISAGITCLVYSIEKKSVLAVLAFLIGLASWAFWWMNIYRSGVAVPEIISALAVTSCIFHSAIKIMCQQNPP